MPFLATEISALLARLENGLHQVQRFAADAAVALRVRNTGPDIPPEARPQLFQRFFRADPAQQRGGHGLGLNLAREIARAHRGDLVLAPSASEAWTEFVLTLPFPALSRQDSACSEDAFRT